MPRFVAIDDTDPSIQYSGPSWFEVNNTQIDTGTFGTPFQNTLHGVNVTASFSFNFSGSEVIVYGTSITTNASGTQDPTWECFIDNSSIGWSPASNSSAASLGSQNNWPLCEANFQDGPHSLTVNATVSNQQTFWFDQIQYTPSASVSLNQLLLRIDSSDPAIQYSPAGVWEMISGLSGNISTAQTNGATLTYQFSGTSIAFFGSEFTSLVNITNSSATYTVDDQDPIKFNVPTPPAAQDNGFNFINNQNLFSIRQLSPGQHNLVVTYTGNTRTIPIGFSYFIQEDETSSTSLTTSTGVPSGTSSSSSPSSSTPTGNHRTPTDAIIGGVIGGLVLIFLLLALFFFNRRRKNWIPQALSEMSHTVPSPDVVNPFTSPSSNPNSTITFLPQKYTSKGQSIPSHFISSKFSHQRGEPSDPASTVAGTSSGSGIPTLTPLRRQFSSPALQFPPSGSSPLRALPLTGFESQTNLDDCTRTRVPQAATEPSIRSPSLQEPNVRFLQHDDSGVRMPAASEDEVQVVELPPVYSPE